MDLTKVLFVCLGNICRSPMAEGIFLDLLVKAKCSDRFEVDSAGTSGHHDGELADHRMRAAAAKHGIQLTTRSRKIVAADLNRFDYILAMDRSNLRNIQALMQPGRSYKAKVMLMREFDPEPGDLDVPDPYYGGAEGFEEVIQILKRSNAVFLDSIKN